MEEGFGPLIFIPGDNNGNYPCCHSLYLECDKKILIDPASNRDRLLTILRYLRSGREYGCLMGTKTISRIWIYLTARNSGYPNWMPVPLRSIDHFFDAYGMNSDERPPWTKTMYDMFHFKPRAADRLIKPTDFIDLGGMTIEVIHTPGHTPGHTSLYFRELGDSVPG